MTWVVSAASLAGGVALLIVGADLLVRGAGSLAKRLSVSGIAIGLTLVAFGTSAPELAVNVFASAEGRNDIVFGNIVGSNIFNLLLILGVSGLIYPLSLSRNTVWKEIPFSLLSALVLLLLVSDSWGGASGQNVLSRTDGLVLAAFFAIFLTYVFGIARVESSDRYDVRPYSLGTSLLLVAIGTGALVVGGRFCLDGAVAVARQLGLSQKFIGCTILAGGTSLPELATSAVAAARRRCDIAVGNVVGSNIFNILAILGASSVIRPAVYSQAFNVDLYVLLGASVLLFVTMFTGTRRRLDRWEAAIMLAGYVGYVAYLLHRR
ncbi:MAG TPA: calcium/sodium antiporter [Phycisphaerae bacterium]|nr:calcium/sodium antiporter [Phycisphaerae bacterium]